MIMTVLILAALLMKKEIVIPCIVGILLVVFVYTGDVIASLQGLSTALLASNTELFSIMLVIAIVTAMSKAMMKVGVDELMIRPIRTVIKTPTGAFWGIGFCMLIVAWLLWPSPAVALIGALLLPVAAKVGLPALWAAVAMNLFGHGMGLSSDFFIQGAPQLTATSAGVDVVDLMSSSVVLWAVMAVSTAITAFILMKRDLKNHPETIPAQESIEGKEIANPKLAMTLAIIALLSFAAIIAAMIMFSIVGGDATNLVAGVALCLTVIFTFAGSGMKNGLEDIVDYLQQGFMFAIKIFTPIIVIAAFFFLGGQGFATTVLGEGAPNILGDISLYIAEHVPLTTAAIVVIEMFIGIITGLDGSGFSGLPLVGSVAQTLGGGAGLSVPTLAALGQITTVFVGGGTIIPWAVVPVAAICGVKPGDLVRKNMVPVLVGLAAMGVVAMFLV